MARKCGITHAETARQAITEAAERERRRGGLVVEAARMAADGAARERVMPIWMPSPPGGPE